MPKTQSKTIKEQYEAIFVLSIIGLIIFFFMFVYGLYNDKPTIEIIGRIVSPIFGFILGRSFYILFCR